MGERSAVMQGCYVDLRFMPGIKCARISIDIPIEHANRFLELFQAPDRACPVPVAIARLVTEAPKPSAHERAPEGPKKGWDNYTRSQKAGIRCSEKAFQEWIGADSEEHAKMLIYERCGIQSRRHLDNPADYPNAVKHFDALLTDYDTRAYTR